MNRQEQLPPLTQSVYFGWHSYLGGHLKETILLFLGRMFFTARALSQAMGGNSVAASGIF